MCIKSDHKMVAKTLKITKTLKYHAKRMFVNLYPFHYRDTNQAYFNPQLHFIPQVFKWFRYYQTDNSLSIAT